MPKKDKTLIMKFGGASTRSPDHFTKLAHLIQKRKKEFERIVVVVSAMEGMTDQLEKLAYAVHPQPPRREYDMLLSAGERISIALLAMALKNVGLDAVSFTGSQSGILTSSDHTLARILDVRPSRIITHLDRGEVVIVAGFQGVSSKKEITTLGRGGSDTSAVALGVALNALKIEFYKDVNGIFENDPKRENGGVPYTTLSYDAALDVVQRTGDVLHPRALRLAKKHGLLLHLLSFKEPIGEGTKIFGELQERRDQSRYEGEELECHSSIGPTR